MFSLYDALPKYLLGKFQLLSTVTFTAFFSLAFILLSYPVSHNAWFELGGMAFLFTVAFFLVALVVVAVSKTVMYRKRQRPLTYLQYILWNLAEALLISILYTFFTLEGATLGIIDLGQAEPEKIFFGALLYTVISLGVPYVVCAQYFAIQDKNNTIRLMNYGSVVGDVDLPAHEQERITLFDNSGVLKFSVSPDNLYFIESDDNYIKVWYKDSTGELKQYMLRCRLKTIEESFSGSSLVRCHRKYVVNILKVEVFMSGKDGYSIDLGLPGFDPVPVSKTYEQAVLARFNSR